MKLQGKTAVITGGSEGIGRAIALRLAREGVALALIARHGDNLQKVKSEIANSFPDLQVRVYPCDITDTSGLTDICESVVKDFSGVDILVNNAGIWQKRMPIEEVSQETVDDIIGTNLTALLHMTRLLLPTLKKAVESAVINISSSSGVRAPEGQSVYAASKWGVRGFTEVLKEDLKGSSVRVAGVYQAGTDTGLFSKADDARGQEKYTRPEDLADVIAYMLSQPAKIWIHEVRVSN